MQREREGERRKEKERERKRERGRGREKASKMRDTHIGLIEQVWLLPLSLSICKLEIFSANTELD